MRRGGPNLMRWFSIALILGAVGLFFYELVSFSRQRARLPLGLRIAGVPVGGIDRDDALQRLLQVYSSPIELLYGDEAIQLSPASVGFRVDVEAVFAAAELARTGNDFWSEFWDFLWGRPGEPMTIPLRSEISRSQIEMAMRDIAARYDQPPIPAQPIPGRPEFVPGQPGRVLDVERATELLAEVLTHSANRRVVLPVFSSQPSRSNLTTLGTLLAQIMDVEGFDGLASYFIEDLRSGEVLHQSYYNNRLITTEPDISFTAGSTIKIGIAVAFLRYFEMPFDAEADRWLAEMITLSGNDPADWLMERIDAERGPLFVTNTLNDLGLTSSYIVAWYRPPAISLSGTIPRTAGNQRQDINTGPDPLNQTTSSEVGMLVSDIYRCSRGGGALLAAFPGQITPEECRHLLDLLAQNKIAVLLEAGVPEGTRVSHKHGWTDSPSDMLSDVGVVFSPGGDYVISLFLWNDPEMIWDPTSRMYANLARAVYNYFNPPASP